MAHILYELFWWPGGIVVGNLIASLMWATPTHLWLHRKLNRHHEAVKQHITQTLEGNKHSDDLHML